MTPIDPSGFLRGAILACESSPPSKTAAEARSDVWYTDAYGRSGRTEPFPGSIRQRIASVGNDMGVDVNGPTIGQNRSYSGGGVRAPN